VKVRTKRIAGSVNKRVTVFSNDPNKSQIVLAVRGKIEHYVILKPRAVNFWGAPDRKLVRKVEIFPGKEVNLQIKKISSTIPNDIKYKLDVGEKEGEYLLTIENIRTTPGRYYGKIIMETNLQEKPKLTLKVYGNIRNPEGVTIKRKEKGRVKKTDGPS